MITSRISTSSTTSSTTISTNSSNSNINANSNSNSSCNINNTTTITMFRLGRQKFQRSSREKTKLRHFHKQS